MHWLLKWKIDRFKTHSSASPGRPKLGRPWIASAWLGSTSARTTCVRWPHPESQLNTATHIRPQFIWKNPLLAKKVAVESPTG